MKLAPEDVEKIRTKNLANIIRKANTEKTLTRGELLLLEEARTGAEVQASGNFVSGWNDLAERLGVSRRALQSWRIDERHGPLCPPDRVDGRKDVAAWLRFMVGRGLKRADELVESDDVTGERRTIRDWKEQREKLMCTQLERAIAKDDNQLLVATELEVPIGATFTVIQTRLSQFPERAARRVTGFTDVQEVEARLREEMDGELTDFHAARWLDESLGSIIASLPFDAETEKQFALVTFSGQDRAALLELIESVARQALGAIGRRVIAQTQPLRPLPDSPAIETIPAIHRAGNPDKEKLPGQPAAPAPAAKAHNSHTSRRRKTNAGSIGSKLVVRRKSNTKRGRNPS